MKLNKIRIAVSIALIALIALIVSLALITPAGAVNYAQIDSVNVYRNATESGFVIVATANCPNLFDVSVVTTPTKIKVDVTQVPNPYAGVCPPDATVTETLTIPVVFKPNRSIYINGVLWGKTPALR